MDDRLVRCEPCNSVVLPLRDGDLRERVQQLGGGWRLVDEHHLTKEFRYPNFRESLAFTVRVGALAEECGHHPDIFLSWGRVRIQLWTHKSDGVTESDLVMAERIERLVGQP